MVCPTSRDPSFFEESGVSNSPLTKRTGTQIHPPPLSPGRPVSNNYSPNRKRNCPYVLNFHLNLKLETVKSSELDITILRNESKLDHNAS